MRQPRESTFLFPRYDGNMHAQNAWIDTSKLAIEKAGLQARVAPRHGFRKTLATAGNEIGLPKPTIRALLGHSDEDITDLYIEVRNLREVEEAPQRCIAENLRHVRTAVARLKGAR
jgi:integrase